MINLPPSGNLPTFEKVSLMFVTTFTWLIGLLLAWKITNPADPGIDYVMKIPLVSGISGIATILLSFLFAPIFILDGEVVRWD